MPLALVKSHLQRNIEPVFTRLLQPGNLARLALKGPNRLNRLLVEQAANRAFAQQIADGDFDFLGGRRLQIEISDASLFVGLGFEHSRIVCHSFANQATEADASLSIDTLNAIRLMQQEVDPDTLFFQRKLRINGDTELAHHVKNTIDTLDPSLIPRLALQLANRYRPLILPAS
jgi:predicted lipid carrier protein YhbT